MDRYSDWFDRFKTRGTKKSASALGTYFAKHFKAGGMVGVTGTPHFFVNGHRFKGALDDAKKAIGRAFPDAIVDL